MKEKISRFFAYNQHRILNAVRFDQNKAETLFRILPFLLHVNHPQLPGYVEDKDCPCGIHLFQADKAVPAELFKKYFPNFSDGLQELFRPARQLSIHSLKTIGSIGTIAQTEKSDCDYWVSVHKQQLGNRGEELLQQKCKAIEEWAVGRGTEVYFFLMDIDQTRENSFESKAEEESAGSALKLLLKDELFRTHILVAGKMPLWWLIPPGLTDDQCRAFCKTIVEKNIINADSFIDLGYLSDIPKAEIFGACLWQMNKALDSPFKSVIKFAYLELLLSKEHQKLPLFSDKIKCLVTYPEKLPDEGEEQLQLDDVDPYLLLAREIVSFYHQEKTQNKRDEIIRECLFMKTIEGVELQKRLHGNKKERITHIMTLMKRWDLLPASTVHISQMQHWKFKDLVAAGVKVHDYLLETYKRLRWFFMKFQKDTGITISERDIAVLGRKLFTFYEKKPDKVEYIRSLSREIMGQEDITIHVARVESTDYYYAFQGELDHVGVKKDPDAFIKRDTSLVPLIVWLLVNGIIHKNTRLHLTKNFLSLALADIQDLVETMRKIFPPIHFAHIAGERLLQKEQILKALLVVNMNKDPVKGAKTLASCIISCNSYAEYFIYHYTTLAQLKNALRLLLTQHYVSRWNNNLEIFIPNQPEQRNIQNLLEQ